MSEKKPNFESFEYEPEKIPEGATDLEIALFLIGHIDNPCEGEVSAGQIENIRDFYIREAERMLSQMESSDAKHLLELKIKEYEQGKH